jgi:hypothetical protein
MIKESDLQLPLIGVIGLSDEWLVDLLDAMVAA